MWGQFWPTYIRCSDVPVSVESGRYKSTDCKCPTLGWGRSRSTVSLGTVDRAVDRPESNCSLDLARSTARSTGRLNDHILTIGRSTGRSTGRPIWAFSYANGHIFKWVINTPFESWFSTRISRAKNSIFSSVLIQVFKRFFKPKSFIFICFQGLEKSKKNRDLGYLFCSSFSIKYKLFSQVFFFVIWFPTPWFLTLELIYYPFY